MINATRNNQHSAAGFTFLETVIAVSVLATVGAIGFGITSPALDHTATTTVDASAQREGLAMARRVSSELGRAQLVGVSVDGLTATYRVPLDLLGSGNYVDDAGQVSWGAVEAGGPVIGNDYRITFVAERVVSEADLGEDLNRDQDTRDAFRLGRLDRITTLGTAVPLTPAIILLDAVDAVSDLNGDGNPDPLFERVSDTQVTLRILRFARGSETSSFMTRRVFLGNGGS